MGIKTLELSDGDALDLVSAIATRFVSLGSPSKRGKLTRYAKPLSGCYELASAPRLDGKKAPPTMPAAYSRRRAPGTGRGDAFPPSEQAACRRP